MTPQEWLYIRTAAIALVVHLAGLAFYFPLMRLADISLNLEGYSLISLVVSGLLGLRYYYHYRKDCPSAQES